MAVTMSFVVLPMSCLLLFVYSLLLTIDISYGAVVHKYCSSNIPGSDPIYTVGDSKFCLCCDPGFFKKYDCDVNGEKAVCMPCESGHYSNTSNQAIRCSLCSYPPKCNRRNTEITQNCTMTTNFDCRCKNGSYFKPRLGSNGDGDCIEHTMCSKGLYIEKKGTHESDTVCRPCESKTYTKEYNKSCSKLEKQEGCGPNSLTICSEVIKSPLDELSSDTSIWLWILVASAVTLAVIFTLVIVFYCLKRKAPTERKRNQWTVCISWLASVITVNSWKPVIRSLFAQMDTDREAERIIQEVRANDPHDVKEQITKAFMKWYQIVHPRNADLNIICNVLIEEGECDLAQKLKDRYPDLLKGNSSEECTIEQEEQSDSLNLDTSSKHLVGEHDDSTSSKVLV